MGASKIAPEGVIAADGTVTKRKTWGRHAEFILTLIGYAVGLGNIWRFPFQVYDNGGGAFIIPFFLALILVGTPTFFLEVSLGQFCSLATIKAYNLTPVARGIAIGMVITNAILSVYYVIIISWVFFYFFASMTSELPWVTCDNSWNTANCLPTVEIGNLPNDTYLNPRFNVTVNKSDLESPSQQYYEREVLKISSSIDEPGNIVWQLALTLLLSWIVVFLVLIKGISSLGKVAYFTSIFPYVLLTVMLVRGATLPGAAKGVEYYLKPDFSKLANTNVWTVATAQIFFSLSVGYGGLTAMASYNGFRNNVIRDSLLVPIADALTSLYGGFAVFCVLGYMAESKNVPVELVTRGGPGLIFMVYPEALATMPAAPLWSVLFFLMMLTLGFSSMFSVTEVTLCSLEDEFPQWFNKSKLNNIIFRGGACFVMYLIGLSMVTEGGIYVFDLVDHYLSSFPILLLVPLECAAITFLYGISRFHEDVLMMLGVPTKKSSRILRNGILYYFYFCIVVLSPIVLTAMFLINCVDFEPHTPKWTEAFGIVEVLICLLPVPIVAVVVLYKTYKRERDFVTDKPFGKMLHILNESRKPTADWGPALPENRTGRYAPVYYNPPPPEEVESYSTDDIPSKVGYFNGALQGENGF